MQRIIFVCKLNLVFFSSENFLRKLQPIKNKKKNPFRCTFELLKSNIEQVFLPIHRIQNDLSRDYCPRYNTIIYATLTLNSVNTKVRIKMCSL
jgi:hypothetical protein